MKGQAVSALVSATMKVLSHSERSPVFRIIVVEIGAPIHAPAVADADRLAAHGYAAFDPNLISNANPRSLSFRPRELVDAEFAGGVGPSLSRLPAWR